MKHNLFFRFCALLLGAALTLSLAVPAFADNSIGIAVSGVSPEDGGAPGDDAPEVKSLSVKIEGPTTVTMGQPATLKATLENVPADKTVAWAWASSDPLVFAPDSNTDTLVLEPLKAGQTVNITATATVDGRDYDATVQVTVRYAEASNIAVLPLELELDPNGVARTVTATLTPGVNTDREGVEWSLVYPEDAKKDLELVTLSSTKGSQVTVTAKSAGQVILRASIGSGANQKTADCAITVRGVALNKNEITLVMDAEEQLTARTYGVSNVLTWTSGNPSIADVDSNGRVTGRSPGRTRITVTSDTFSDSCEVTVVENTANTITGSVAAGGQFSLSTILSDLERCCQEVLEQPLDRISNLSVAPAQGTLYYNYVSSDNHGFGVGSSETYYLTSGYGRRQIQNVCFVPNPTFTGTAVIRYNGLDASGRFFTGQIRLTTEGMADVTYSAQPGEAITFRGGDFSAFCQSRTGNSLSYLTFTLPDSAKGTLYYNYATAGIYAEKVGTGRYYVVGAPSISQVTFLPADGFAGKVVIPYRGVSSTGAVVSGQATITVAGASSAERGSVRYTTRQQTTIAFQVKDFQNAMEEAFPGLAVTLDYVRFTLPAASEGQLIYDPTEENQLVSASDRYYRTGRDRLLLSKVHFSVAQGFSGDVMIPFTGYTTNGRSFEGTVQVTVEGEAGEGQILYTSLAGQPVPFEAADFNEACLKANGQPLSFLRFTLPDEGELYVNYNENTGRGTPANKNTHYTRGSSGTSISRLTYVPEGVSSSQVYIPFSGEDATGYPFVGMVVISIEGGGEIRYTAFSGRGKAMSSSDFDRVCQTITGAPLNYVRFELPDSSAGVLYHRYQSAQSPGVKVAADESYYRTGGDLSLDQVYFVPVERYTGNVTLRYTGWSTSGIRYTGTVDITVSQPQVSVIRYAGDVLPVTFQESDFRQVCSDYLGTTLSHIRFTNFPSSATGSLRLNYESPSRPGTAASVSVDYAAGSSLGALTFIPKAGYEGRAIFYYTAYDTSGAQYAGTVELALVPASAYSIFADLSGYSWASPSITFLYRANVVQGTGGGNYGPGQSIRRGDFALMLCRAFGITPNGVSTFTDVPANSYYSGAIASAQRLGLVTGNNGRFSPNASLSRQDAMVMIQRAMTYAGRQFPTGGNLSAFSDGGQVSGYARAAVTALIQLGIIQGSGGKLQPTSSISRAEMAVILHRVLTLS